MENNGFCRFCRRSGRFASCHCGYSEVLECDGQPSCLDCERAHKKLGAFFRGLATSNPATRANSPRVRLLHTLCEAVASFYDRESSTRGNLFAVLRKMSPFNENQAEFRGQILSVIRMLPLNGAFASALMEKVDALRTERAFEKFSEALIAELKRNSANRALREFCASAELRV